MAITRKDVTDFIANLAARSALGLALVLPYRWRVPLFGKLMAYVIAPVAGYTKRIRENLAHVLPDMPEEEVARLCKAVPDNAGRSLIEIYSGDQFKRRVENTPIRGPGLQALRDARKQGRPVVLVSGHFGNYDVPRAVLMAEGCNVASLYRPMTNRFFNRHYVRSMSRIAEPVFEYGRAGMGGMIRFLKGGGVLGFFIDNHVSTGQPIDFFGKPAPTSFAAAEMALKYDALLLSTFGIRQPNGIDFEIVMNAPIEPSDPETMMLTLTAELEEITRAHMDQWFWIHRRWKPERQRSRAAANIGP